MDLNPEHNTTSRRESASSLQDLSEILDLSNLDLDNQETWLYEPQYVSSGKCINTATFTRPKRRYMRASISDLEQIYQSAGESSDLGSSLEGRQSFNSKVPQTVKEEPESVPAQEVVAPLQFDLQQPISLHNFDSFMLSSQMCSFQNMSPPSLVNSLCSSTFSSLMENSFIKNDPILREIRDKDFMEASLLQDMDPPDAFLESFMQNSTLKNEGSVVDHNITVSNQTSLHESTRSTGDKNVTYELGDSEVKNSTYSMETGSPKLEAVHRNALETSSSPRHTSIKHNATFRKSDLKNRTTSVFKKEDIQDENIVLDRTSLPSIENDLNTTNQDVTANLNSCVSEPRKTTKILRSDSIELLKKRSLSDGSMDLNRLSHEETMDLNRTFNKNDVPAEINCTTSIKRMSVGSADSLDRMSSLSSSSKSSNPVHSIEDIEEFEERFSLRRLSRVMSTPMVAKRKPSLNLENGTFMSPIVANTKDPSSDSELSDEYKSVTSQPSSNVSLETWAAPRNTTASVNGDLTRTKPHQRAVYTMPSVKPSVQMPPNMASSNSNPKLLKNTVNAAAGLRGSYQSLHKLPGKMGPPPSTNSNLRTMSTKLKGSYTSLRPISANLPVAPPLLNGTHTISRPGKNADLNVTKPVVKSTPFTRPTSYMPKPDQPRVSGLPRPTGIPRPTSRIPGSRSGR